MYTKEGKLSTLLVPSLYNLNGSKRVDHHRRDPKVRSILSIRDGSSGGGRNVTCLSTRYRLYGLPTSLHLSRHTPSRSGHGSRGKHFIFLTWSWTLLERWDWED